MKYAVIVIFMTVSFLSCKNNQRAADTTIQPVAEAADTSGYFPVTSYLRGQITDIRKSGINPLKYTINGSHTDSAWLKQQDLEKEMNDFLYPVIDTLNMTAFFDEKKFLDQSVNAYTFTYNAKGTLPDTMQLRHWDVYVDPETGKVQRIFMQKEIGNGRQQQLTWQSGQWCKMITLGEIKKDSIGVLKEIKINWNF